MGKIITGGLERWKNACVQMQMIQKRIINVDLKLQNDELQNDKQRPMIGRN